MQVTLGTWQSTPQIEDAVSSVLRSGRLSYGPVSQDYEQRFASMHDCAYGVVSNSGTSSLVVALQALKQMHGWRDGDEVIVPALTFVASVNAILHNRLTPVLVDVSPHTFNIEPSLIESAITDHTRCIMPVHLFGQPAAMKIICAIARKYGLSVVEDSCESVLATIGTVVCMSVGAWGDVGCFSTYAAHHLVTGVGGMATTCNLGLAKLMRSLVNHGIDLTELPNGKNYDPSFLARKFRFTSIGHSFRMTELEAAIGVAQLDDLPAHIEQRRKNAEYLITGLTDLDGCLQTQATLFGCTHSWMVFPIVMRYGSKWPVMHHLQAHGIECREMVPLTNQPCYNFNEADYPVSQNINERGFYIGCHQGLTTEHLDYVIDVMRDYFNGTH